MTTEPEPPAAEGTDGELDEVGDHPEGLLLDDQGFDKYSLVGLPEIDCETRYPICQAACCTLQFPLSPQDLDEGVIEYDPVLKYLLRHGPEGYCVHIDLAGCRCTVYEQRPAPCRIYDCRDDDRIWVDFEGRIPNPRLWTRTWKRESALRAKQSWVRS